MKKSFLSIITGALLFLNPIVALSQDTITEIVIVNKKVYVVEEKNHNFYFYIGPSFSINKDYYNVCPDNDCITYFQSVKETTKNFWNNSYTTGLAYSPGKFYSELSFSYSRYRDKFKYTDPFNNSFNSINHYDYLDIGMIMGYKIKKWWYKNSFRKRDWRQKTTYILLGGMVINKLISVEGNTLSKKHSGKVIPVNNLLEFYDYNYRFETGARMMYYLKSNFYFMTGLFYSYDVRSIIKTSELYIRQRNIIGINFYLMYNL